MEVLCAQGRTTSCKLKLAVDMARTAENAKQTQQVGPFLFLLVQRGNHRPIVECCHTLNTRCPTPMDLPNALLVRSSAATPNQLAHEPHTSYKLDSTPLKFNFVKTEYRESRRMSVPARKMLASR